MTPDPRELAVELSGVTRMFGLAPALVRIDLRIARGECLLVRGPNGAGKSTLLRVIATALSPTSGRGRVLGFDLLRERQQIRARTDLLGHRTRLYEDLTGPENLRFMAVINGADPGRVAEVIERVGLADARNELVRGFSQGMRQRLAVGRLFLRRPDLMLLDEPYAGLDWQAQALVDGMVRESLVRGATVVMVTHDAARAGRLATRSVLVHSGRLHHSPSAAPKQDLGGDAA